jgi:DNA-binding LacI/PurR family transcriptional regulator
LVPDRLADITRFAEVASTRLIARRLVRRLAAPDQSYLLAERKLGIRVVFLDREPRFLDADAVVSGNRAGAVAEVDHLKALNRAGLQETIALVGFDDFALADALLPGVTVITQDTTQLGRLAAQLLFARLDGDDSPARTHVVPTGLVMRGSGEIRPPAMAAS